MQENGKETAQIAKVLHVCQKLGIQFQVTFVTNNRVVFNVKGNDYRIICSMDYARQAMFIKFVGTHKEYDKVMAGEVE